MGLLPMDADILPPSDDRVLKLVPTKRRFQTCLMDLISSMK